MQFKHIVSPKSLNPFTSALTINLIKSQHGMNSIIRLILLCVPVEHLNMMSIKILPEQGFDHVPAGVIGFFVESRDDAEVGGRGNGDLEVAGSGREGGCHRHLWQLFNMCGGGKRE